MAFGASAVVPLMPSPEAEMQPTLAIVVEVLEGTCRADSPSPRSPERNIVAAVVARSRLASAAAGAVIYLWLAGLWVCHAGMAAEEFAARACGKGSRAHAVASVVSLVSFLVVMLICPVALALHFLRDAASYTEPEKCLYRDMDAEEPAPEESSAARMWGVLCSPLFLELIVEVVFELVLFLGRLVKMLSTAKGSRRERIGDVICDVGLTGHYVMFLFVLPLTFALRVWWVKKLP